MNPLIDTSMVVRIVDESSSEYAIAGKAMEACLHSGNVPYLCTQNIIEFWNVATRPKDRNGLGWSDEKADYQVRAFQQGFTILQNDTAVFEQWLRLVRDLKIRGKQVHDAHIAAFAIRHGASSIMTFNSQDFTRFAPYIEIVHPIDFVNKHSL